MQKLERQLGLLATLLHTERPLPASEIQHRIEGYPEDRAAFRRAFERDKDDLRRLGIPIEVVPGDGDADGYRVRRDDYYLHDLGLEADEVVALALALRVIRLEGVDADDALWKLGGATVGPDASPVELGAIAMGPAVAQVHAAIAARAAVTFDYRSEPRRVEPWRLAFRRGHWYLSAWDTDRADARSFRLDRIDSAIEVGEPGSATSPRGPASDRQPWQFTVDDDPERHRARLAVDEPASTWLRRHLGDDAVVATRDDGGIEVEVEVTNVAGFRSFVLSLGAAGELLGPDELRADLVAWLEAQVE